MKRAWVLMVVLTTCATVRAGGRKPPLTGILWDSTVMHNLDTGEKEVFAKPTPPWRFYDSQMSPDGKQLLFTATMWDKNGKPLITDLRTLDVETREEQVWYRGPSVSIFGWSPDGRFIVTEGLAPEYVALIIDTQTEEAWLVKIPKGLTGMARPVWSRDGKSLYLVRSDGAGADKGFTIMKMDLDGKGLKELVSLPMEGGAAVSPDEKTVAYVPVSEQNLYFVDVATGKMRLTKRTPAAEMGENWSPDGKWVTVRKDTRATMEPTEYFAVNLETGEWRFLFKKHGDLLSWWQPPSGVLPDCAKIVREQLGPGRQLQDVAMEILKEETPTKR